MENRFGIKDFFLFALILVVIVLIVLAMVQVDRQWKTIQGLQESSRQQGRDLVEIRRTLADGISVSNANPTTQAATQSADTKDPFKSIKEIEAMPGFARGDWFIDNFEAKLKAVTPFIGNDVPAAFVQQKVFEGFMCRDVDTLEWIPMLAKSWKVSADGKVFTFYLRRGVTFSDGEPFTADDVLFSFDWIRNPQVNAPRERSTMDLLQGYRKIDDYTVEFTFKEYFFKSLEVLGTTVMMSKKFYSQFTPDQFNETPGLLMGTGPYKMEDPKGWTPGQRMMLVRNDRYWGTPPAPNRLIYLEVEEETAYQTMFTNGEIDYCRVTKEQYVKMKDDPKVKAISHELVFTDMMKGYGYIAWNEMINEKPSVFKDKKVRQAMTMLIDRDAIARDLYYGYGQPATGPFSIGSKQRDETVKPWPYDPQRAKAQLKEVGIYDRDDDGVLDTPDGKPFRFKLTYPSKLALYERMTLFIKDGFAKAGIIMERDPVEWPVLQQRQDKHEFDAIMLAWSGAIDDDPYQMFHSSQISDQGDNKMSYNSPELDAAIVSARTCVDEAKRIELWHTVHRILAEDCPYTFVINSKETVFVNNRWQNVRKATIGLNYNKLDWSPMPWFVPQGQQRYTKQ